MYKRRRYISICVLLVCIIAVIIGCMGIGKTQTFADAADKQIEQALPKDLVVSGSDEASTGNSQVLKFSSGLDAINYGLNILQTGKGYTSYFTQTLTSLGYTQNVATKKYRSGDLNILEEWYDTDFAFGQNAYKCFFTDQNDMKIKTVTNKNNFSFDDLTSQRCAPDKLESFPYSDWTQKRKRNPLNDFFVTLNADTCRVLYFDKSNKTDYVIKVSVYPDKLDESYFSSYKENGASDVVVNSLIFCFYVNKTTGHISKITKEESVNTSFAKFVNVDCKIKSTEIFLSVDSDTSELISQRYQHNFA